MVHFLIFALLPLQLLSPAAPAAGSAASWSAPAAAPGWGRSGLWLGPFGSKLGPFGSMVGAVRVWLGPFGSSWGRSGL